MKINLTKGVLIHPEKTNYYQENGQIVPLRIFFISTILPNATIRSDNDKKLYDSLVKFVIDQEKAIANNKNPESENTVYLEVIEEFEFKVQNEIDLVKSWIYNTNLPAFLVSSLIEVLN